MTQVPVAAVVLVFLGLADARAAAHFGDTAARGAPVLERHCFVRPRAGRCRHERDADGPSTRPAPSRDMGVAAASGLRHAEGPSQRLRRRGARGHAAKRVARDRARGRRACASPSRARVRARPARCAPGVHTLSSTRRAQRGHEARRGSGNPVVDGDRFRDQEAIATFGVRDAQHERVPRRASRTACSNSAGADTLRSACSMPPAASSAAGRKMRTPSVPAAASPRAAGHGRPDARASSPEPPARPPSRPSGALEQGIEETARCARGHRPGAATFAADRRRHVAAPDVARQPRRHARRRR